MERTEAQETIRRWCSAHPGALLFDPDSGPSVASGPGASPSPGALAGRATGTLFDVFAGKAVALGPIVGAEERRNRETGQSYLALALEDGRSIALTSAGLAFAPDVRNTGPLPSLPSAVCLRDFAAVAGKLRHILDSHADEGVTREEVDMAMFCLALLDGARAVGFDVGREEAALEELLGRLERAGAPGR